MNIKSTSTCIPGAYWMSINIHFPSLFIGAGHWKWNVIFFPKDSHLISHFWEYRTSLGPQRTPPVASSPALFWSEGERHNYPGLQDGQDSPLHPLLTSSATNPAPTLTGPSLSATPHCLAGNPGWHPEVIWGASKNTGLHPRTCLLPLGLWFNQPGDGLGIGIF